MYAIISFFIFQRLKRIQEKCSFQDDRNKLYCWLVEGVNESTGERRVDALARAKRRSASAASDEARQAAGLEVDAHVVAAV